MKTCLLLFLVLTAGLRADLEFSGFFLTAQTGRFALTDTRDHTFSGWLKLGQTFAGYTVESFDPQTDTLSLRRGGETLHLKLRDSKVQAGRSIITGKVTLARGETLDGLTTTLFLGEETVLPLKDGVKLHLTARRLDDGNLLYNGKFELLQPDGTVDLQDLPGLVARPGQPFSVRIGDLGFSFKP